MEMEEQLRTRRIFAELEERLARLEPKDVANLKRDRWPVGVMFGGVAMTLLPVLFGLQSELINWITVVGLVLELCGLGVFTYRQIRDLVPDFIDSKRKFSIELDSKLLDHEDLLVWLRTLPSQERSRRIAYLDYRLESMAQRYQIMFGAVDKLGILSLIAALFVQMQAIKSVSMLTAFFAFVMFFLYGMAMWLVRFRLQMQRYVRLLREAEASDKPESHLPDPEAI